MQMSIVLSYTAGMLASRLKLMCAVVRLQDIWQQLWEMAYLQGALSVVLKRLHSQSHYNQVTIWA